MLFIASSLTAISHTLLSLFLACLPSIYASLSAPVSDCAANKMALVSPIDITATVGSETDSFRLPDVHGQKTFNHRRLAKCLAQCPGVVSDLVPLAKVKAK